MKKPYVTNLLVATVLIAAGLYSYFSNENRPPTALIAPVLGLILIALTPAMKKENKVVAHIVVLLTLLFGIISMTMAIGARKIEDPVKKDRRIAVFTAMSIACFAGTGLY